MFRPFDPERDREATRRIWREVGWHDGKDTASMDVYVDASRALVGEVDGQAECLVLSMPGTLRYLGADLSFAGVMGVTTSLLARGQGLATGLTARLVAEDAAAGALVSGLGMFEQGFYDRLGFGSGGYDLTVTFDPADLTVGRPARVPRRLTKADGPAIHAARLRRHRGHGAVSITPLAGTVEEELAHADGYGLGFGDGDSLTHGLWLSLVDGKSAHYRVRFLFARDGEDVLDVLRLLRSLADQVRQVSMREPLGIQLQDLLAHPLRSAAAAQDHHRTTVRGLAKWQMRLNDLPGCLAATSLSGPEAAFNVELTDPITDHLPADQPWRGVAGRYAVHLGARSSAERGWADDLPLLTASVNAFTRLWLGVRPATGLAVTDDLAAPPELLRALDISLRLPQPHPDWDF
jgi:predicted acetyltransferase